MNRNVRHSLWPEVYEMAIAPYTAMVTTLAIFAPKRGKFNVTAKGANIDTVQFDWRRATPLILIVAVVLVGFVMIPFKVVSAPLDVDTILIAAVWNLYNLVVLTAAILAALERPQRRVHHRVDREIAVEVHAAETEDQAWFQPLTGATYDLSLGGCSLQIPGEHDIPARANLVIRSHWEETRPLGFRPIAVDYDAPNRRTLVRGAFEGLDVQAEADLSRQIFSASDAWVGERYRWDGYWRSVLSVFVAILSVGLGNPEWLRKWSRPKSEAELEDLVPGAIDRSCTACGAPLLFGASQCEACGTVQPPSNQVLTPPRLTTPPRRPGISALVMPAFLVVIAIGLSAGYRPLVEVMADIVPMQRWEKVTHQTRLGMLTQAWFRIEALTMELERTVIRKRPISQDWGRRLWEAGRDYKLMDESLVRQETENVERELKDTLSALDRARRSYDPNVYEDPNVASALENARANLERAGELLRIPRKDRRVRSGG
jgi:hypothetical protein